MGLLVFAVVLLVVLVVLVVLVRQLMLCGDFSFCAPSERTATHVCRLSSHSTQRHVKVGHVLMVVRQSSGQWQIQQSM